MSHPVISNQLNRRSFLNQSALGLGTLAGLPSLSLPLFAAAPNKASRIEALELLVLKRNREQRRAPMRPRIVGMKSTQPRASLTIRPESILPGP